MTPISSISTKGIKLRVHVVPNSSYSGFAGVHDQRLKIKIKAKALEGAANEAVKAFLAKIFGISKSRITLLSGAQSKNKTLEIEGDSHSLMRLCNQFASAGQET